ncbi:MAG: tRNA uridine-5-carboxymethylaminomethyl(34) synthesis GTPase MnmE, partial [Thiovulaceae bacterium]|nr:tRNA uridine-5-carboxymethylaminomethyl(34) synthesis GTPase MnmE [Sulfurimonadaceae bacterium]
EANDAIEKIGIERSLEAIVQSDIVVALFDASRAFDSEDAQILSLIETHAKDKRVVFVKNKIDLQERFQNDTIVFDLALNTKEGGVPLIALLEAIMDATQSSDEMMLISQRQIEAVSKTLQNIEDAFVPLADQELEIFSFHLNEAIKETASITRPFENDEMLDKMFGSFCLGK